MTPGDDAEDEEEEVETPLADKKRPAVPYSNKKELLNKVFRPHVQWTKHDYDTHDRLYEQLCPSGGPGGLTCCEVCSAAYSRYLTQTAQDVEVQTIHNAGMEIKECTEFMKDTQKKLQDKVQVARTKAPPLPRDALQTARV